MKSCSPNNLEMLIQNEEKSISGKKVRNGRKTRRQETKRDGDMDIPVEHFTNMFWYVPRHNTEVLKFPQFIDSFK